VEDIRILSTLVRTHDGVYTRVPNQEVFTSSITNYVAHPARRVEYSLGIGHAEDVAAVRGVILSFLRSSPYALVRPGPEVSLSAIADDRLVLSVYFWTPSRSFTAARSAVLEGIQKELAAAGIEIPAPRRHVSLSGSAGGEGPVSREATGGRRP